MCVHIKQDILHVNYPWIEQRQFVPVITFHPNTFVNKQIDLFTVYP